jgi:sugar lactone lactonase YvrE
MNVNFGPKQTVYTAEAGSGRVMRFSPDGKFLEVVGAVELVPGCKKVSIAVSPDGGRVYMLDITRGHIVVMESKDAAGRPDGKSLSMR